MHFNILASNDKKCTVYHSFWWIFDHLIFNQFLYAFCRSPRKPREIQKFLEKKLKRKIREIARGLSYECLLSDFLASFHVFQAGWFQHQKDHFTRTGEQWMVPLINFRVCFIYKNPLSNFFFGFFLGLVLYIFFFSSSSVRLCVFLCE